MSEEQKGFWGCIVLIGIALLIGVGLRSKSIVQFLVMGAVGIIGIVAILGGVGNLSEQGCWEKLQGLWWGFWGVLLTITVGHFLVTGDYDKSVRWLGSKSTPTVSVQPESTLAAGLTSTQIVQVTVTPTPLPTSTPTPTSTPVLVPTETPEAAGTPSPANTAWYSKFLADRSTAQALSKQLEDWRLYLGIILGLQYLVALYVARRTKQGNIGCSLIGVVIGSLLVFTKLGEWIYKLILWVFGWGLFGKIVAVILALLTGLGGIGNITVYIIAGYIFYDEQVMRLCVLPSAIVAFVALFIALQRARKKRFLQPSDDSTPPLR